jgi:uncharacterized protein
MLQFSESFLLICTCYSKQFIKTNKQMLKNYQVVVAIIIGFAIIMGTFILGRAFRKRNENKVMSVTGLSKKDFIADLIVWRASFSKKNMELKTAYESLDKDRETIRKYLLDNGLKENEIIFSAVNITRDYVTEGKGEDAISRFDGFMLKQDIQIESKEVDKIDNISRKVSEVINAGVELNSGQPEYYYTQLAQLKVQMLSEASQDARLRAEKITESAKGSLGSLKSADMGIFQITAQNSNEDYSWGGTFNTTSKKKTATVTVKLNYELE